MMNRSKCVFVIFMVSLLASNCAAPMRPLLTRGISEEERRFYVIQNGYGLHEETRQSFLDGNIIPGMNQDLIFQMYGSPDRTKQDNTVWEYVNSKGILITGMKFKNDSLAEIYGDPTGGRGQAVSQP